MRVDELQVIQMALSGVPEEEILVEFGLDFDGLDEIMEGHGFGKCASCGAWIERIRLSEDAALCPGCQGRAH